MDTIDKFLYGLERLDSGLIDGEISRLDAITEYTRLVDANTDVFDKMCSEELALTCLYGRRIYELFSDAVAGNPPKSKAPSTAPEFPF